MEFEECGFCFGIKDLFGKNISALESQTKSQHDLLNNTESIQKNVSSNIFFVFDTLNSYLYITKILQKVSNKYDI